MNARSALLETAYDDYCRLAETSPRLNVDEFLNEYPSIRSSLRRQIQVHQYLDASPDLLGLCKSVDWPAAGSKVFDFDVVEELGRGAFARVYLCRQAGLGRRQVVVKFALDGAFEADMLGRLTHPNIMPVYSVECDELTGTSAICMPFRGRATFCDLIDQAFADGRPPRRGDVILRVAQGAVAEGDRFSDGGSSDPLLARCSYADGIVHLGIQLADALQHAHGRGILHGDIKPSNVLLTPQGRPLLLDFNLACGTSSKSVAPGGTLPYMPPEHLERVGQDEDDGQFGSDERADVFSLAAILYELLSGRLPFGKLDGSVSVLEQAAELVKSQRAGPIPLWKVNPAVDRPLAAVIEQSLSFDSARRPATAAAFARELRHCLSPPVRGWRWVLRHKVESLVCCAALVLCVTGVAAHLLTRPPYPVRLYKQAVADYNQGNMPAAIAELNRAVEADPKFREAMLLRACAHVKKKEYNLAYDDFKLADGSSADLRCTLGKAYCLCRLKFFRQASVLYQRVLNADYREVDAHNNLAYAYLHEGNAAEARPFLDLAAAQTSDFYQIFLNRALTELQQAREHSDYFPKQGLADSEQALQLSPANAELELYVARLNALAARTDASRINVSLTHLERACELGLQTGRDTLSLHPDFALVKNSPRFRAALGGLKKPPGTAANAPLDRLIEPSFVRGAWPNSR